MGFYPEVSCERKMEKGKSYMLVANHNSIIDIMLMLAINKHPFIFIGKVELTKIPLFGYFYRKTCILVDRKSQRSRQDAFKEAQHRLRQGNSICIFPEGGVPEGNGMLAEFKDGAFRLAIEHQIPIVPITFHDTKRRFPYSFFCGSPGKLRVKIHKFMCTKGKELNVTQRKELRFETRHIIMEELQKPTVF